MSQQQEPPEGLMSALSSMYDRLVAAEAEVARLQSVVDAIGKLCDSVTVTRP